MIFLDTSDLKTEEISLRLDHTAEADPVRGWVPAYYFDILDQTGRKLGICDLRVGHTEGLYYGGNIGYAVDEPYRGRNLPIWLIGHNFDRKTRHLLDAKAERLQL